MKHFGWKQLCVAGGVLAAGVIVGPTGLSPQAAHAIIGRPLTPVSYAGVARRTTRRTVAATTAVTAARMTTLPAGCGAAVGGVYRCGSASYRAVYDGPDVVYIED
jgi:hypothetical protein